MIKKLNLAVACLATAIAAVPAYADGLVDNINGMTLTESGQIIRFNAMVIDDEGKVKKLLDRNDERPVSVDFRFDGKGKNLIPGFVDAHGHVMGLGFAALVLDLSGTNSLAEAQAAIAKYAEEYPNRPWIIGRGWNQEKWGLNRFPTAAELDVVVSDRPVWMERVDGHAGWANSAADEGWWLFRDNKGTLKVVRSLKLAGKQVAYLSIMQPRLLLIRSPSRAPLNVI